MQLNLASSSHLLSTKTLLQKRDFFLTFWALAVSVAVAVALLVAAVVAVVPAVAEEVAGDAGARGTALSGRSGACFFFNYCNGGGALLSEKRSHQDKNLNYQKKSRVLVTRYLLRPGL